jgi:glycosyltransferase involved in cell wall biosynthesis
MVERGCLMPEPSGQLLNVTFVIPYFYPAWRYGGQPRSAFELARALVRRGHRVKVLTTDSAGDKRLAAGRKSVEGVEVIYYRNVSNWLAFHERIFWPVAMFRELHRELAGSDLIHIHELRSTISVFAYRAALKLRLPYVLSTHGGLRHLGRKGIKVLFDTFWGRRILRDAAAIIAISPVEESDARLLNVDQRRIRRLPNMISLSDYESLPPRGLFRARWGLNSCKVLLFLGRLHWIKGADLLIHAFKKLCVSNASVRLVIAGPDDGQEAELRSIVRTLGLANVVTFTGFFEHQAKLQAFVDADVIVIPSRSEVFAITALEALMCACPVLISDACGLHPMPSAEQGVRLFKTEDVDNLAAKLAMAIADPSFQANARNGKEFVMSQFSAENVSQRAESIYCEVRRN